MTRTRIQLTTATLLLLGALGGCRQEALAPPAPESESAGEVSSLAALVPYGREPWPGIVTAGQPSRQDLEALQQQGLATVINLRVPTERGTRDEAGWAEELGLTYVSIPVEGAGGINAENARALNQALETAQRPVLVHCGSSNRVGAILGLRAFLLQGLDAEKSLEVGRSAGVTKLEGRLRELLER